MFIKERAEPQGAILRFCKRVLRPFAFLGRFIGSARIRAEYTEKTRNGSKHYQVATYTAPNRYPLLFKQVQLYLQPNPSPKILSFGCSTGEEVSTLSDYLPGATIFGVDINSWCIKQCIKKNERPNHFFYHRLSTTFDELNEFDTIFCMAVFQQTANRTHKNNDKANGLTFQSFEEELVLLHSKLKIGGLLIIDFADFSFMDTVVAKNYTPLPFERNQLVRKRPLFNRDNKKISEECFLYRVFVKNG